MSEAVFFILEFLLYVFCIGCTLAGPFLSSHLAWVKYNNNSREVFANIGQWDKLTLIIKNHKYKILCVFLIFYLMNVSALGLFLWVWIITNNNLYLIIPFIITFLLSHIAFYLVIKILFKKLSMIGIDSQAVAIEKFKKYQNEFKTNDNISTFKLYQFDKIAPRNQPLQFNQWRYDGKIRRLNNKNYNNEKYKIKLLNIYIRYLKTYAIFFKFMENDFNSNYSVEINNHKYDTLEPLKKVLIDNFFAYVNRKDSTK